jgi:hypothetical protein
MFCLLNVVLKSQLNCKLQQGIETVDKSALCRQKASWGTLQKYNFIEQFISHFASLQRKDNSCVLNRRSTATLLGSVELAFTKKRLHYKQH